MMSLTASHSCCGGELLGERAHLGDDLARPVGVLDQAGDRRPRLVEIGRIGGQPAHAGIAVGDHRGERLIDLVRDRGGEFAQRGHTADMRELRARLIGRGFFRFDLDREIGRGGDRQDADRGIDDADAGLAARRGQQVAEQRQGDAAEADQNDAARLAEPHRHQNDDGVESRERDLQIGDGVGDENAASPAQQSPPATATARRRLEDAAASFASPPSRLRSTQASPTTTVKTRISTMTAH